MCAAAPEKVLVSKPTTAYKKKKRRNQQFDDVGTCEQGIWSEISSSYNTVNLIFIFSFKNILKFNLISTQHLGLWLLKYYYIKGESVEIFTPAKIALLINSEICVISTPRTLYFWNGL